MVRAARFAMKLNGTIKQRLMPRGSWSTTARVRRVVFIAPSGNWMALWREYQDGQGSAFRERFHRGGHTAIAWEGRTRDISPDGRVSSLAFTVLPTRTSQAPYTLK